jgi:hypothetical protein
LRPALWELAHATRPGHRHPGYEHDDIAGV